MATKNRAAKWDGELEYFALQVGEERTTDYDGGRYFHIRGRVVGTDSDGSHERGKYYTNYSDLGKDVDRLALSCQSHDQPKYPPNDRHIYAYTLAYEAHMVDLEHAERYARVLKAVHAKLARYDEEDGEADTFGQWVLRVCKALGIQRMRVPAVHPEWSDDSHRVVGLADGKYWINSAIYAWQHPQPAESTAPVVAAN